MRTTRSSFRALLARVVFGAGALVVALAGPVAAKPTGSGGAGPAAESGALVPDSGTIVRIASDIQLVLFVAGVVIASAVLTYAVVTHGRGQRTASTKA